MGDGIASVDMRSFALIAVMIAATIVAAVPAHAFSASFSWKNISACDGIGISPSFRLSQVPKGTVSLAFNMDDLDAPDFQHGGSTVQYQGNDQVPRGAITYIGPCPPPGQRHRYRWTVQALDAQGRVLAKTTTMAKFPP